MAEEVAVRRRYKSPQLIGDPPTLEKVERLGKAQCSLAEMAPFLGATPRQVTRLLEDREARVAYERGKANGIVELREAQMKMAESSVPMAMLMGKLYLNQDERRESDENASFDHVGAAERVRARIAAVIAAGTPTGDRRVD